MIITETDRLVIRHLRPDDDEAMQRIFCDPEVMKFSEGVKSRQWVRDFLRGFIETHYEEWGFGVWAVERKDDRETIGYCGISRFPKRCRSNEVELGYRLARAHWGNGYATEAARAVVRYAVNSLHLSRIIAMVDPHNEASVRVAQNIGMRYERDVMFEGYTHPDHVYVIGG